MKDAVELILEMYKIQIARSEHYEDLRATLTNVVLAISTGLSAVAMFDNTLSPGDGWLGATIVVWGIVGYSGSKLHANRSRRHGHRAAAYRDMLDKLVPTAGINVVRQQIAEERTWLNRTWSLVHLGVVITGLAIVLRSRFGP